MSEARAAAPMRKQALRIFTRYRDCIPCWNGMAKCDTSGISYLLGLNPHARELGLLSSETNRRMSQEII